MSEKLDALPEGWAVAKLDDVADWGSGGTPKRSVSGYYGGHIPWVTIADLNNDIVLETKDYLTEVGVKNSAARLVPENTILLALYGSIGKLGIAGKELTTNQAIATALPNINWIDHKYLFYYLASQHQSLNLLGSGVTQKNIYLKDVKAYPIQLAPRHEQTRIVEKLEELLSDLDNGVAELKAAQIKLTQYRQSLLKSAVEGTLTEEWRKQNQSKLTETGEQLLARILKERREQWEQTKLAEFKEKGKKPPKDWQKKYTEPVQPEVSELPELPEGWVWASLDMVGDIVSGVTKGTKRKEPQEMTETPYLRVANVQRGYLDLNEIKTIPATADDIKKYTLKPGDILFNEGGDRDKLGRGWVWYGEVEGCIHQNHVFRLRTFISELVPELISHYGNTFGKLWFQNAGKQTTNLASINKGILQSFPIPVAPIIEQIEILERLNIEVSNVDNQIEATAQSLNFSVAQRKNVLKDAFSGKLVPQHPEDEPAQVLLERIKAERAIRAAQPKPKRPKKKEASMSKLDTNSVKKWVVQQSEAFTFEQLKSVFKGDYDTLKDIVFEMLQEEPPLIKQVFSEKRHHVMFEKTKK